MKKQHIYQIIDNHKTHYEFEKENKVSYHSNFDQKSFLKNEKLQMSGFGFSPIQSSSTLRFSSSLFSFSKDQRFKYKKNEYDAQLPNLKSTLKQNGTSLGFGQKRYLTEALIRNMNLIPGPGQYNFQQKPNQNGKSFGKTPRFSTRAEYINYNPGPGKYQVRKEPGKDKPKIQMLGFRKIQQQNEFPSPQDYKVKTSILYQSRQNRFYQRFNELKIGQRQSKIKLNDF